MAILVIADDLTGASEIGGIVLRYGLSVEIVHRLTGQVTKDVLILNTNTRSLPANEVEKHLEGLFSEQVSYPWDWIFLKFDSALRGHIKSEISFYRGLFQKDNVLFCPVNPAMSRVIRDGIYWVDGHPLAETDFAKDPEFPMLRSEVLAALGAEEWHLITEPPLKLSEESRYVVAAVENNEQLDRWASTLLTFGMYGGSATFLEALLRHRVAVQQITKTAEPIIQMPALYVCGSKHEDSLLRKTTVDKSKVVYWRVAGQEREVARDIRHKLLEGENIILAAAPADAVSPRVVRMGMAQVVAWVQQEYAIHELLVEGGATARAVLEALGVDTLVPIWEYGQGVIRNAVPGSVLHIILKPGSYPWTAKLWVF